MSDQAALVRVGGHIYPIVGLGRPIEAFEHELPVWEAAGLAHRTGAHTWMPTFLGLLSESGLIMFFCFCPN